MKLQLLVTVLVWVIAAPTWAQITFNLLHGGADGYAQSIHQLRDALKMKDRHNVAITCHGLPVLARHNSRTAEYLLVELQGYKSISVAIDLKTIYVTGYADLFNGKCRSFVFNDVTGDDKKAAETILCHGAKGAIPMTMYYSGSYSSLEGKAGKRKDVEVGIDILKDRINYVYGQARLTEKKQAQFLMTVVQMVSEAVRFEYIVDQVKRAAHAEENFLPNPRMITLENEWNKITQAIALAPRDGNFGARTHMDLENEDGTRRVVTNVRDIRGDVGLLNHVTGCKVAGEKLLPYEILVSPYLDDLIMGGLEGF